MFFNKFVFSNKQIEVAQNICILGTSSTAFFIAKQLQNIGHNINIICNPRNVDELNATDLIFKDRRQMKTKRSQFDFCFELRSNPEFLFIASLPQNLRSDLLLISHKKLEKTTIINLTPSESESFVSNVLNTPVIAGYFSAWLHHEKNHISLLEGTPSIKFTLAPDSERFKALEALYDKTDIAVSANNSAADNFWQWFASQVIIFLISEAFEKNFYLCTQDQDGRNTIKKCLKEIINISTLNGAKIEKTEILKKIYNTPESYISFWHSPLKATQALLLERISNMLFNNNSYDTGRFPTLKNLINKIENKL